MVLEQTAQQPIMLIRPPPEIRAAADRTALHVVKHGRTFEQRILASARGQTPKFAFLQPHSPFYAYYESRIEFYTKTGGKEEEEVKNEDQKKSAPSDLSAEPQTAEEKPGSSSQTDPGSLVGQGAAATSTAVVDPIAKAVLSQRAKIASVRQTNSATSDVSTSDNPPPSSTEAVTTAAELPSPTEPIPKIQYLNIVAPSSLSGMQLSTIQLTAQFVALDNVRNAKQQQPSFLQQLMAREWQNPTFSFAQPRHGHFPYFTALVDAYARILHEQQSGSSLGSDLKEMAQVDSCLERAAYRAEYERDRVDRQRQQLLSSLQHRTGEESLLTHSGPKVDWHDFVVVETIDFSVDEVVPNTLLQPPPPPSAAEAPKSLPTPEAVKESENMEESDQDDDDEHIRVVPSYTPMVVGQEARIRGMMETVIDPITGRSVPVQDLPEHLRIQLLDPKWAEEQQKFRDKQKDSNLVGGDDVAMNLARFASARGGNSGAAAEALLQNATVSSDCVVSAASICLSFF
jgi:Pre-mRNA splicing factor PRP21 like protein/Surp module